MTVLSSLRRVLNSLPQNKHLYVAYSGGLDSQVLLHALAELVNHKNLRLTALHVNYGFSDNADSWQAYCEQQCERLGLPILVKKAVIDSAIGNLEQRARDFRYQWFESIVTPNAVLLTAHHQDDQAETVILRLLRSSGVHGLAAIPPSRKLGRGKLLRPFLDLPKADLRTYAEQHGLSWVEDESNENEGFERNLVRHQILPRLVAHWPQAAMLLARSAYHCRQDQALINEFSELDVKSIQSKQELTWFDLLPPLALSKFSALSIARQRNLIQYLIRQLTDYPLSAAQLSEWLAQIKGHTADSNSCLQLDKLSLQIYDGRMHFLQPTNSVSTQEIMWKIDQPLEISELAGELRAYLSEKVSRLEEKTITLYQGDRVRVHWRRGGERVYLPGDPFSRSLKKILQQRRIAPWLRQALPLISIDEHIVWSAALGCFSPKIVNQQGRVISFELKKNKTDSG